MRGEEEIAAVTGAAGKRMTGKKGTTSNMQIRNKTKIRKKVAIL
jgi:hypothetical protein